MISENTENFLIKFFFDLLASIFCRQKFGQIYDDGNDDSNDDDDDDDDNDDNGNGDNGNGDNDDSDGDNNDNDNTDFEKKFSSENLFLLFLW